MTLLLAALVSSDALMFFSGDLPYSVPNRAIYDAPADSSKVLRLTPEVAAGYWSTVSGLIERGYMVGETWPYHDPGETPYTFADFKTNSLTMLEVLEDDSYGFNALSAIREPANRVLSSPRLSANFPNTATNALTAVQATLQRMADHPYEGWGWSYARFGSTWFDDLLPYASTFPSFGWTNSPPCRLKSSTEWACVWPTFTGCVDDFVWKSSGLVHRDDLAAALRLFDDSETQAFADVAFTNPVPVAAFALLTNRLGSAASAFTNSTPRVSYYRLGALQSAVGAMDRTYRANMYDLYGDWPWMMTRITLSRACSASKSYTVPASAINRDYHTVDLTAGSGEWVDGEKVISAVTNRTEVPRPFAGNYSSSPRLQGSIGALGGGYAVLGPAALEEMFDRAGVCIDCAFDVSGDDIVGVYSNAIDQTPEYSITIPVGFTNMTIDASAFVSDAITVGFTDAMNTNATEHLAVPSETAYAYYRPEIAMNTIESAGFVTNWCEAIDGEYFVPGYHHPAEGWTGMFRSVRHAASNSRDAVRERFRTARRTHRNAVADMFTAFHGRTPTQLAESIALPEASFARLKADVDAVRTLSWGVELSIVSLCVHLEADGSVTYQTVSVDGTVSEWVNCEKGDFRLIAGGVYATDIPVELSGSYPDRIAPFEAYGSIYPAFDLTWTFRNLAE